MVKHQEEPNFKMPQCVTKGLITLLKLYVPALN